MATKRRRTRHNIERKERTKVGLVLKDSGFRKHGTRGGRNLATYLRDTRKRGKR